MARVTIWVPDLVLVDIDRRRKTAEGTISRSGYIWALIEKGLNSIGGSRDGTKEAGERRDRG